MCSQPTLAGQAGEPQGDLGAMWVLTQQKAGLFLLLLREPRPGKAGA